ncbi:MAG: threonine/serine dehydratase [Chloroflexota bacterium]
MSANGVPTLSDVFRARRTIAPYLRPTPLHRYQGLCDLLAAEVYVKHENHQPVGAFKVRGGINLVANLGAEERRRGVIAASTGNHGQSVAYGARTFGVDSYICMPHGSNPGKVAAIRSFGAEIIFHGVDFDEALEHAARLAGDHGYRFIHSANEPYLIAGVGTYGLEIVESLPEVEAILVPVGGGSGASGTCIAAKGVNPAVEVIGVQAEKAPAAYLAWKGADASGAKMETFAEGLATRVPFEMTQAIMREMLDDFVVVSEDDIRRAIVTLLKTTHNLAEGAAASTLAAALQLKERLKGRTVVLVMSGGNLSLEKLRGALVAAGEEDV